jgi:hypothetical protein
MGCLLAATKGLESNDMKISLSANLSLPYTPLEEGIGYGEDVMSIRSSSVDRCKHLHASHSTACRLTVVCDKQSNVNLDTSVPSCSLAKALQYNDRRSLTGVRSSASPTLFRQPRVGGHPQVGGVRVI